MKKTHWLRNTLIVLIICGLIGTVLAAILFNGENNRTYATASIQFSFEGAAEVVEKLVPPKKAALKELNMKALSLGKNYNK